MKLDKSEISKIEKDTNSMINFDSSNASLNWFKTDEPTHNNYGQSIRKINVWENILMFYCVFYFHDFPWKVNPFW